MSPHYSWVMCFSTISLFFEGLKLYMLLGNTLNKKYIFLPSFYGYIILFNTQCDGQAVVTVVSISSCICLHVLYRMARIEGLDVGP
jgi:hypothetical protein